MTHDITPLSAPAVVESYVRGFIVTDTDGAQRVNEAGLQQWLAEQFGYLTTSGAAPTSKDAQAGQIASALQAVVGREHWQSYPDYPGGGSSGESVKARLIELRSQMAEQVNALTAPYREFESMLATRARALFNTLVVPSLPAGVQRIERTCAYVETFVTDWGEESAPSPVSALATLDQNDNATIAGNAPPDGWHITLRRLYRSATGTTQSAYELQGEYPIAQTVIVDSTPDAQLNDVCATFGWREPPATLQGLIGMANGIMLGYDGSTLYACEPYAPYAWPLKYTKPLAHAIVGIVAVGQSAFIGTSGRPYLLSGSDSASLSEELISSNVPCVAARSMVAIGGSVFYAAPDGLALYENGRVEIVTKGVIDRAAWSAYNPASMRAGEFDGMYLAFFTRLDASCGALVFDYENRTIAELEQSADAVFSDASGVYALNGGAVLDLLPAAGAHRSASWHSKSQRLARPQGFSWLQVDSDFTNAGDPVTATVRIYADDGLHATCVLASRTPVRLPPGRFADWRVEIECAAVINGVVLATTTDELKALP